MSKFRFLLLDANVVFHLLELDLWDSVVDRCEVLLARTVAEQEVRYYHGKTSDKRIDLSSYSSAGKIRIVDVDASALREFLTQFDPVYLKKLDPGEAESLAYLCTSDDPCYLCSSDTIVYRVLAALRREDQAISLEEVLQKIGFGRSLPRQFTKAFRDRRIRNGKQEGVRGIGLK